MSLWMQRRVQSSVGRCGMTFRHADGWLLRWEERSYLALCSPLHFSGRSVSRRSASGLSCWGFSWPPDG
jgi:hypothetical protein